ncbi:hypothetical protein ABEY43_28510 [Priestia megaterium]
MGAKTPYALLSFVVGNHNLQERTNVIDMFLQNIDPIAVEKIDKIEKEKNISRQEYLKVGLKRKEVLREIKDNDKGRREKS